MSSTKSNYPNAYCLKCGSHTDTLKKHTVVLTNSSRALKGVCAACESEVYKILPKIKAAAATSMPLTAEEKKKYPDAFCVKCKSHTPTSNAHTVVLENMSRAVTGQCKGCGSDVYRILGARDQAAKVAVAKAAVVQKIEEKAREEVLPRRSEDGRLISTWTYVAAAGVILGIIAAFFVYAVL